MLCSRLEDYCGVVVFYQTLQYESRFSSTIISNSQKSVGGKICSCLRVCREFLLEFFFSLSIFFLSTSPSNIHIWPIRPGCEFPRGAQWKSHDVNAQPRNHSAQRHFPHLAPAFINAQRQHRSRSSSPQLPNMELSPVQQHSASTLRVGLVACRCTWFNRKRHD